MKMVKLEVDFDTARVLLSDYERKISDGIRKRDELNIQITRLEEQAKSLRTQLQDANGAPARAGLGDNKTKIKEYLAKIAGNAGARMVEIQKATGIGTSSVAFTLANNKGDFVKDGKIWKLK